MTGLNWLPPQQCNDKSHPSHVLQPEGHWIVAVLLFTVVVTAGAQHPLIVEILHQATLTLLSLLFDQLCW